MSFRPAEKSDFFRGGQVILQGSAHVQFLDVAFSDLRSLFSQEKRSHYELCRLISEVVMEYFENKINQLNQCLTEKWDHVMFPPAYFHGQQIK